MKVTGIGGVFFKAKDPATLRAWYKEMLGIDYESWGSIFFWKDQPKGSTSFSIFKEDSTYYENNFMINFRFDALLPLFTMHRRWAPKVPIGCPLGRKSKQICHSFLLAHRPQSLLLLLLPSP